MTIIVRIKTILPLDKPATLCYNVLTMGTVERLRGRKNHSAAALRESRVTGQHRPTGARSTCQPNPLTSQLRSGGGDQ